MQGLITAWFWIYVIGIASFYAVAILAIPLGAVDLWKLFRLLGNSQREKSKSADPREP